MREVRKRLVTQAMTYYHQPFIKRLLLPTGNELDVPSLCHFSVAQCRSHKPQQSWPCTDIGVSREMKLVLVCLFYVTRMGI